MLNDKLNMQENTALFHPEKRITAGETPEKSKKDQNLEEIFTEEGLQRNRIAKLRNSRIEEEWNVVVFQYALNCY